MKVQGTSMEGLFVLEPTIHKDDRGYFMETFNEATFAAKTGANPIFVQDNESSSEIFTIRGLHYQEGEFAQAKLVRVSKGAVMDVVVDIRPDSTTYGKTFSILLNEINKKQLYIPRGFAHGFSVLEENTIFNYKCDNYYKKDAESGINPFDSDLNINWYVNHDVAIMSEKDKTWKDFCEI